MLQSLLAERFKLVAHRGLKEFPIYALVLTQPDGSPGARMTPSQMDCGPDAARARSASGNPPPSAGPGQPTCGLSSSYGRIAGGGVTMAQLARHLPQHAGKWGLFDRQVIDRTGLSGRFDFTLQWTPDTAPSPAAQSAFPISTFRLLPRVRCSKISCGLTGTARPQARVSAGSRTRAGHR